MLALADFAAADLILVVGQNPGDQPPSMLSTLRECARRGADRLDRPAARGSRLAKFAHLQLPLDVLGGGVAPSPTSSSRSGVGLAACALFLGLGEALVEREPPSGGSSARPVHRRAHDQVSGVRAEARADAVARRSYFGGAAEATISAGRRHGRHAAACAGDRVLGDGALTQHGDVRHASRRSRRSSASCRLQLARQRPAALARGLALRARTLQRAERSASMGIDHARRSRRSSVTGSPRRAASSRRARRARRRRHHPRTLELTEVRAVMFLGSAASFFSRARHRPHRARGRAAAPLTGQCRDRLPPRPPPPRRARCGWPSPGPGKAARTVTAAEAVAGVGRGLDEHGGARVRRACWLPRAATASVSGSSSASPSRVLPGRGLPYVRSRRGCLISIRADRRRCARRLPRLQRASVRRMASCCRLLGARPHGRWLLRLLSAAARASGPSRRRSSSTPLPLGLAAADDVLRSHDQYGDDGVRPRRPLSRRPRRAPGRVRQRPGHGRDAPRRAPALRRP